MSSGLAPGRSRYTTKIIADEVGLTELAREWDALLDESAERVYFLRAAWTQLWWQTFRPPGAQLFIITVRDSSGRLAGLAPFYLRSRRTAGIPHVRELQFIGTGVFVETGERLDLIVRRGEEGQVAEAIAARLLESDAWDRLCLNEIPATSLVLPHLRAALGEGVVIQPASRAHFIHTTGDWERVLDNLSRSTRKNLLYETRRLFKTHACQFRRIASDDDLERAMDRLVRLHQARWNARGEPGSFAIPGFESFLRDTARASLRQGLLRMWALDVDGQTAAVLIGFYDNGVVHYFQVGFDPRLARLSIGRVMLGLCIRDCVADPLVREFDFMGGGNAYKDRWTHESREMVTLICLRTGVRALAYTGLHRVTRLSKSLLKATLPAAVRQVGHRFLQRRHFSR
ncbi:MAG TPA: GNAT family N-acetyltransferase [Blastocatellia bacterium]|nr:GNAT family N-acetyltransferase [Blastocatellia bacterium]